MTANGFHYDGRTFASAGAPETTGADGSVPRGHYHQTGDLVWGEISGGAVRVGSLAGTCGPDGTIRFAYCQVPSTAPWWPGEGILIIRPMFRPV